MGQERKGLEGGREGGREMGPQGDGGREECKSERAGPEVGNERGAGREDGEGEECVQTAQL